MPEAFDEYLETTVLTATPQRLHLIVVDAAIRHALAAEKLLKEKNLEHAHGALNHSRRCVAELISGLDASRQPEMVENLTSLFIFAHRSLVEAGVTQDPGRVTDSLNVLRLHRDTWLALDEKLRQESAVQPEAAVQSCSWTT
jgi:flagellar secretion chaperone FliS